MKNIQIELKEWDYTCPDNVIYEEGVILIVNGEECINSFAGEDVSTAVSFILNKLGVKFTIKKTCTKEK